MRRNNLPLINTITKKLGRKTASKKPLIWQGDVRYFLEKLSAKERFDLVVTSPPYNIGKPYEERTSLENYLEVQEEIIKMIVKRTKQGGSICWQVGNFVENGEITPLDIELHKIFKNLNLTLRNRIIWRYGHGLHNKKRFSGRYEIIMWYTKGDDYTFNLDAVRVPAKYPGKKSYRGDNKGKYSSNPKGKNPEDVWDMDLDVWQVPNVKNNHIEKSGHPCQFPVGLVERLVLALTNEGDLVFDPYLGSGTSGVAAAIHNRRVWGCEIHPDYAAIAERRIAAVLLGEVKYRPYDKPLYDHRQSKLSIHPDDLSRSG